MDIRFWYFLKHWKRKWKVLSHEDLEATYCNWKNADRNPGLKSWLCYWLAVYNLVKSRNLSELQYSHFIQWEGEIKLSISFLPALKFCFPIFLPETPEQCLVWSFRSFLVLSRQNLAWPRAILNYMSLGIGKQNHWHICKGSWFFNIEASIFRKHFKMLSFPLIFK